MRAEPGAWSRALRGVTLEVAGDGAVAAPSCRRLIGYIIVVGARVSIARTDEAPKVFGNPLSASVPSRARARERRARFWWSPAKGGPPEP